MAENKTVVIFDGITGETIEQELSQEEIAERKVAQAEAEALIEAREAARNSALAKLAALGLTEAEIAAL